ncbi:MAG TPA: hypothetical protein PKB03_10320 [Baekduia sp.]|nr:hypothetical protein [Baekduia sp.]
MSDSVANREAADRRRLWHLPGFKPLAASYAINDIGDLVAMVALAVFIYDTTDSVWALAAMFTALKLVPALIAPWAVARLAPRKAPRSLPVLYSVEAAAFALLAVLVMLDAPFGWLLLLAAFDGLLALVGRGLTRGVMATIFDAGGLLRAGNAFVSKLNAWLLIGATGGAYLVIRLTSAQAALWVNVGTFLAAGAVIVAYGRRLPSAEVTASEQHEVTGRGRTREGLAHVWSRPRARRLLVGEGLAMTFGALVVQRNPS